MSLITNALLRLLSRWFLKSKPLMVEDDRITLKVIATPQYSTDGLPGFAVIPTVEKRNAQTQFFPINSARVIIQSNYSTHSKPETQLGEGLFSVTKNELRIHISQSDMDSGIPMGVHVLGTVNENGQVLLLENVRAAIQVKYDKQRKTNRIDLTFVLSEVNIDRRISDIEI